MNYVFMSDVSADLTQKQVSEIGIEIIPMEFHMEDKSILHYPDCRMMSLDEFYTKLKSGADSKTTQINYNTFTTIFESYLKAGKDVIYTGISSGLSGTYNTCLMAVNDLKEKYPDRKIIAIDSTCDCAGLGLLVFLAGKKYNEGASIEELEAFINETKTKICHWFIVEDLDHLKRGGRISAVTAAFGKALQIKPLLSVDEKGALLTVGKVRGKSNIIPTLLKYIERDGIGAKENTAFIAHADNIEGALELQKKVKSFSKDVQICDIGPVIGSHVGSGMLALTFIGNRNYKA